MSRQWKNKTTKHDNTFSTTTKPFIIYTNPIYPRLFYCLYGNRAPGWLYNIPHPYKFKVLNNNNNHITDLGLKIVTHTSHKLLPTHVNTLLATYPLLPSTQYKRSISHCNWINYVCLFVRLRLWRRGLFSLQLHIVVLRDFFNKK